MFRHALLAAVMALNLCGNATAIPPTTRPATTPATAPAKVRPGTLRAPRMILIPFEKSSGLDSLQFTPDGRQLVWRNGYTLQFWNLAEEQLAGKCAIPDTYGPCLSPDLKTVAVCGKGKARESADDQFVKVYDVASGRELKHLVKPPGDPADWRLGRFEICGFDRTSSKLYTGTAIDLQAWDLKTGAMLKRIAFGWKLRAGKSKRSPGGRYFTIDGYRVDPTPRAMAHQRVTAVESTQVFDTDVDAFLPLKVDDAIIGRGLGFATDDQLVKAFHDKELEVQWMFDEFRFAADDSKIYGTDSRLTLLFAWSLPDGKMIDAVRIPWIYQAHVSQDASRVVVRPSEMDERRPRLRMFEMKTQKLLATFGPLSNELRDHAVSPDFRWIAMAEPGVLRLYDVGPPPAPATRPAGGARGATRPVKP